MSSVLHLNLTIYLIIVLVFGRLNWLALHWLAARWALSTRWSRVALSRRWPFLCVLVTVLLELLLEVNLEYRLAKSRELASSSLGQIGVLIHCN